MKTHKKKNRFKTRFMLALFAAAALTLTGCAGSIGTVSSSDVHHDTTSAATRVDEPATLFGLKGITNVSDKLIAESSRYHQDNIRSLRSALERSKNFSRELKESKTSPERYPASFVALAHLHDQLAKEKDPLKIAGAINAMYNMAAFYDKNKAEMSDAEIAVARTSGRDFIDDPLTLMKKKKGICGDVALGKARSLSEFFEPENVWLLALVTHDFKTEKGDGHLVSVVKIEKEGKSDYYVLEDLQPGMDDAEGTLLQTIKSDPEATIVRALQGVSMASTLIKLQGYIGGNLGDKGMAFPFAAINMKDGRLTKLENPIIDKVDPLTYWSLVLKPPQAKEIDHENAVHPNLKDYRNLIAMSSVFAQNFLDESGKGKPAGWAQAQLEAAYHAITNPDPTSERATGIRPAIRPFALRQD